ncbi:hypothetical protein HNV08_07530 [Winogradskyella eckloniae]|uniref:hypothetical protein n=1 Tax=Winogradskyella eckloniae TaxID=1089306 RepID=UPI0015646A1D|nr:hypothetical protein [Winogradskyella eckloniae]NRD19896.1 hypothetical protein [Winogradskyella eckloniae]
MITKQRPILIIAIVISLAIEILLIVSVYSNVGSERLPAQIGRLVFQLIFMVWALTSKSNTALFVLMAYHLVTGFIILNSNTASELIAKGLIAYHILIGLMIYFHEYIEGQLFSKNH